MNPTTNKYVYETFGHMLFEHMPFILAGAVSLIGATMMILKKLGFLSFDKEEEKSKKEDMCKHCSFVNGNNTMIPEEAIKNLKCDTHESLCDTVKDIRATQIRMDHQQKSNMKSLSNGKDEFQRLHDRINDLRVGVAVLLDRAGAKVKEFKDVKIE